MKLYPAFAAAIALACVPVVATAQRLNRGSSHSRSSYSPQLTVAESRKALSEFAMCVVKREHAKASALVLKGASGSRKEYIAVSDLVCLDSTIRRMNLVVELKFASNLLEYAVAEALYRSEVREFERSLVDNATINQRLERQIDFTENMKKSPASGDFGGSVQTHDLSGEILARLAFYRFGECIVRAEPNISDGLVRTQLDSPQERTEILALGPAMSGCLQQGEEFKINASMLRGVLATRLYTLVHASHSEGPAK